MRRREFIAFLGGAAGWPLTARAQQTEKPVIGFLDGRFAEAIANRLRGFHRGLREAGYVEGENVTVLYRYAENQSDRLPALAGELTRRSVAVIVASGGPTVMSAAKQATAIIPVVFLSGEDPVRAGLVAGLARPGGNLTGINFFNREIASKQLEFLRELVPSAKRIAVLVNPMAYKIEELNKLFSTPLLREMPTETRIRPTEYTFENAMAWIPLIALFSGMRSNEICQMRAGDVRRKDGIWVFNVSEERAGQSLKTTAAARVVPVHSELIRCGFVNYLKVLQREGQLFPALKSGGPDGKFNHYFAKRFTVYRRGCSVTAPRTSFHSFRKNVAQALKDKRATPAEIAELIGHEQGFTLSVYAPMQLPLPALRELIERVKYTGLRLNHLYTPASD